jgi:hypothetical protein
MKEMTKSKWDSDSEGSGKSAKVDSRIREISAY